MPLTMNSLVCREDCLVIILEVPNGRIVFAPTVMPPDYELTLLSGRFFFGLGRNELVLRLYEFVAY